MSPVQKPNKTSLRTPSEMVSEQLAHTTRPRQRSLLLGYQPRTTLGRVSERFDVQSA